MPNAKTGNTTTIQIGAVTIGEVKKISPVTPKKEEYDATTLASTAKEVIVGLPDYATVNLLINFYTGDTGQAALRTAFSSGTLDTYIITFPTAVGATWTFTAYCLECPGPEASNELLEATIVLRISGAAVLGTTASGGLTALALTGAGGTLVPTFGVALRYYMFSGVSAASVTITPTAASHTIKLYIDGVYSQDISSGAASNAIALTINVSKLLTLIVYEAAKTPITYEIVVLKTS